MDEMEALKAGYPDITETELHFYNMKFRGMNDPTIETAEKRPVFYLFDDRNFNLISFLVPDETSPYSVEYDGDAGSGRVLYRGEELPFDAIVATRLAKTLPHYYFRGPIALHPTLDKENILNTNFNTRCSEIYSREARPDGNVPPGCKFCIYYYRNDLPSITPQDGMKMVEREAGDEIFKDLKEIAVVTGRFDCEKTAKKHLLDILSIAKGKGFEGRLHYIGSQVTSPEAIMEILDAAGGSERFMLVYTVERFEDRQSVMHGHKGRKDVDEILSDLKILRECGLTRLQYSYLPGIENLEPFRRHAHKFVDLATPHLSIFRKTGKKANEETLCSDYESMGPAFICEMREHFEKLYGKKIIGNNFANIWPFPLERIDIDRYLEKMDSPMARSGLTLAKR